MVLDRGLNFNYCFMKKIKYLFLGMLSFTILIIACSKNTSESHWEAQIDNSSFSSVSSIFKNSNSDALKSIKELNEEAAASEYLTKKANEIASFYYKKKNINLSKDFIDNPDGIVIFGLFMAAKESNDLNKSNKILTTDIQKISTKLDESGGGMSCFFAAIGGVLGIRDARDLWKACLEGASEQTLIASIKLMGKRVAGVLTLAIAVYEVGECLDWW